MIAKVIVDLALDQAFDYLVPPELEATLLPGCRVWVPFGNSRRSGYVLALSECADFDGELKSVQGFDANRTQLPESLLKLGRWIADYYCCAQEYAIRTLLPAAVRHGRIKARMQKYYTLTDRESADRFMVENADRKPAAARVRVLKCLSAAGVLSRNALLEEAGAGPNILATLLKAGLITEEEQAVRRNPFLQAAIVPSQPLAPTPDQAGALAAFDSMLSGEAESNVMLLFGVTGSGKTEVYLQAIARVLEEDGCAIVLVPEISLTPQTVRRFRARFGDQVSVLHSRLTDGERFDEWNRIRAGEVKIAVGARSALFAPFERVRLIIVDEEHESSYKQSETPRYHARDVAVMRGSFDRAVVILGSATPSVESYHNALHGKYVLCELNTRAEQQELPEVRIVDLRLNALENAAPAPSRREGAGEATDAVADAAPKVSFFSKVLIGEVFERLRKGEQVIIFLNRRGYSRQMQCEQCGHIPGCPDCSAAYTYHRQRGILSCHLCGAVIEAPDKCPMCGSDAIHYGGTGTERIESQALAIFKGARIFRMDSDSMRGSVSHEQVLDKFRRGEIDILIGTQMIAKGLHFPNVTLVGVINADMSLLIPDFRAGERTFQLLTQVAGRAGRGEQPGVVIVQTFSPFNDVIRFTAAQDYRAFYEYEVEARELFHYPPFGHLLLLHFLSEDAVAAEAYAVRCAELLKPFCHDAVTVVEPGPSPIARIKGRYRFQLQYRGENLKLLRQAVRQLILRNVPPPAVEVYADIDAQSLS